MPIALAVNILKPHKMLNIQIRPLLRSKQTPEKTSCFGGGGQSAKAGYQIVAHPISAQQNTKTM